MTAPSHTAASVASTSRLVARGLTDSSSPPHPFSLSLQGEGNEVGPYRALTSRAADRSRRDRTYGGVATPASVTMAVMRWWGVMSNAGFAAAMPSGATGTPRSEERRVGKEGRGRWAREQKTAYEIGQ